MNCIAVKIDSIKIKDLFTLSDPVDPELHKKFKEMFPGIPELLLNERKELISGYDSFIYLRMSGVEYVDVCVADIDEKDSLFFAYNRRKSLKEFNLFEKISFIKKIIDYSDYNEIYKRTGIDIAINEKVLKNSNRILKDDMGKLLKKNLITVKTALKLVDSDENNRLVLTGIFAEFPMSASMQRNLLELTEEIIFRDKCTVSELFGKIKNKNGLTADEIILRLKRLRYPEYSKYEDEWKRRVKKLKVPKNWKIFHSPFFEKNVVELRIVKKDLDEIESLLRKIGKE